MDRKGAAFLVALAAGIFLAGCKPTDQNVTIGGTFSAAGANLGTVTLTATQGSAQVSTTISMPAGDPQNMSYTLQVPSGTYGLAAEFAYGACASPNTVDYTVDGGTPVSATVTQPDPQNNPNLYNATVTGLSVTRDETIDITLTSTGCA